jgi:hypothetical protein
MPVADTVPVTLSGLAGFSPYTYLSACFLISARRHTHSARAVMRLPSSLRNGSGSLASVGRAPASGRMGTGQPAPSSSTAASAAVTAGGAACAAATLGMTATAAPAVSATASPTTVERSRTRLELMNMECSFQDGEWGRTPASLGQQI